MSFVELNWGVLLELRTGQAQMSTCPLWHSKCTCTVHQPPAFAQLLVHRDTELFTQLQPFKQKCM